MAASVDKASLELGFVESTESFLLRSRFFPSKIGGKPAWLSLSHIPSQKDLLCIICLKPMAFLLQVYAPDSTKTDSFHRTIYVFVCRNEKCCRSNECDNFKVFRSQLPRENDFYSATPPVEIRIDSEPDASLFNSLCVICGCQGNKRCGKCHKVNYCSKEHQTIDWKAGHKVKCQQEGKQDTHSNNWLFHEFELVTETEILDTKEDEICTDDKLREYNDYMKAHEGACNQLTESELETMATVESANDKQLQKFKKRIAVEPEQVLRYQKGGEPLWIADSPKPTEIPDCHCGATRQFEFQILPQLLSHLNVDKLGTSLDWGILCVYTCKESCSIGNRYVQEVIFKQDLV